MNPTLWFAPARLTFLQPGGHLRAYSDGSDYKDQCRSARAQAEEYFEARNVVSRLLARAS